MSIALAVLLNCALNHNVMAYESKEHTQHIEAVINALSEVAPEVDGNTLRRILQGGNEQAIKEMDTILYRYLNDGPAVAATDKTLKDIKFYLYNNGNRYGHVSIEKYSPVDGTCTVDINGKVVSFPCVGLDIDLEIKAEAKTDPFESYQWKQVVYTNDQGNDTKTHLFVDPIDNDEAIGECIRPYYYTVGDIIKDPSRKKHFYDSPSRGKGRFPKKLAGGKMTNTIWWQAELALYGLRGGKETRLLILQYGFDATKLNSGNFTVKLDALRRLQEPTSQFRQALRDFLKKYAPKAGVKCY